MNTWKAKTWLSEERNKLSKWNKKHFSLFHKCCFRYTKQISKNVADTTFNKEYKSSISNIINSYLFLFSIFLNQLITAVVSFHCCCCNSFCYPLLMFSKITYFFFLFHFSLDWWVLPLYYFQIRSVVFWCYKTFFFAVDLDCVKYVFLIGYSSPYLFMVLVMLEFAFM